MSEKDPSGVSGNNDLPTPGAGTTPGGPFPQSLPAAASGMKQPSCGLQYLIAVIKKPPLDSGKPSQGIAAE